MALFSKRYHLPGTAAGTLVQADIAEEDLLTIRLIDYNASEIIIHDNVEAAECQDYMKHDSVTWVHVQGHPTEAALHALGDSFQLHLLALEDVLNTGQRPKIDSFDDQLFIVMNLPMMREDILEVSQVCFFLSKNSLVSFCASNFTPFEQILKRLQDTGSRLRARSTDFLLYSLLDEVIDEGFPVLEQIGQQLEELEEHILFNTSDDTLSKIHILKRELIILRRAIWPQREVINQLLRDDYPLVQVTTLLYLRDCYDHTIQVVDLLETYRELTAGMLDIYLSSVSNRMNDIMRVLTVIATIFIPLTFIVGVYGMNFKQDAGPWSMPELSWPYGYLMVWVIMFSIAGSMLAFFRRRGWF